MSQEKVDRYKKEKANREKIMRRERWITRPVSYTHLTLPTTERV